MPGLLDRGQAALARRQKQTIGRTVVYSRGAESVTLTPWLGKSGFTRDTEDPPASVTVGDRDYLFLATELVIAGQQVLPREGDRITETDANGEDLVFKVLIAPGAPPAEYADLGRTTLRIHTQRVKKT